MEISQEAIYRFQEIGLWSGIEHPELVRVTRGATDVSKDILQSWRGFTQGYEQGFKEGLKSASRIAFPQDVIANEIAKAVTQ